MLVICIRNGNYDYVGDKPMSCPLIVGNPYTVLFSQQEPEGLYYALEEFGDHVGFDATLFAVPSNIDETAFERDYNTVRCNEGL